MNLGYKHSAHPSHMGLCFCHPPVGIQVHEAVNIWGIAIQHGRGKENMVELSPDPVFK